MMYIDDASPCTYIYICNAHQVSHKEQVIAQARDVCRSIGGASASSAGSSSGNESLLALMDRCLAMDPSTRPDAGELVDVLMPFSRV